MNALLPFWNTLIVHPLMHALELVATPFLGLVPAGVAGGLAIILFTILLRLLLVPLSLVQIRSQRHQMAIQPELKALQKKFKGDREGMARAQMQLYKERGINPAAGCLPLLIQMPILFGMYAAMSQLATQGLTLDQVGLSQIQAGQVVYAAERHQDPLPFNQFVLAQLQVAPHANATVAVNIQQDQSSVSLAGKELLTAVGQDLTLTPGSVPGNSNANPPNTPNGSASVFLRSGVPNTDGITMDRDVPVPTDTSTYYVEVWVNAAATNADSAKVVVTYDPSLVDVTQVITPTIAPADLAFKSPFLWLPSLGQPDTVHLPIPGLNFPIPGLLLIIMTITSFVSQRMTTMPTEDPQQQAMMRSMAFMPLMYLFFFVGTPAGLVLYWLTSNVFSSFQQYFTVGLGLLGGDVKRLTGRDLQPPWATLPASSAPVAALVGDSGNGRVDTSINHKDVRTPGSGPGATGATRRPRPGQSKGRKRGKR
ncbi:MAG: YidC/Oxa1 family membrane protein insertase [Chloroflexota bacterium]|nr:YidC/Oxa1 family membrane protein insertase [Chloroflexota bacterium]